MTNFGFTRLRVVKPYDVAFREARSAVGASAVLASAKECDTVAEAVRDCTLVIGTTAARDRELKHELHGLSEAARRIHEHLRFGTVALLFGSEKRGLSNQDLSHCHWLLRIPSTEAHPSMNLAQAVAVTLYELARDKPVQEPSPSPAQASMETLERLTGALVDSLVLCGYAGAEMDVAATEKVRRLVRRLDLSAEDADTLLGIMRQILWKLKRK